MDVFGQPAEVVASAPGRVNLIGEHTDYNGGFVLPTPIPQLTTVAVRRRNDRRVRVVSAQAAGDAGFTLGEESPTGHWTDYVAGVTKHLAGHGHELSGFDMTVDSRVPLGSGLSSSAALLVATFRALRELFGLPLDDVTIAKASQAVENDFVGARVGIMDPLASSVGRPDFALFVDTHTLERENVPLPPSVELVVLSSGVRHQHAGGDYNTRRGECEAAARELGIESLRDLRVTDLPRLAGLPEPLGRRARHVATENFRVWQAVAAMRADDAVTLGRLFDESHRSQCDDYAVSVPAIDALIEATANCPNVFGARLTGGGFGGSIVALAAKGQGAAVADAALAAYHHATGNTGERLVP